MGEAIQYPTDTVGEIIVICNTNTDVMKPKTEGEVSTLKHVICMTDMESKWDGLVVLLVTVWSKNDRGEVVLLPRASQLEHGKVSFHKCLERGILEGAC